MTEIYMLCGMVLVTFLIRYTLFATAGQVQFPYKLSRALRYVPPAVLTAIIVPSVLMPKGAMWFSYTNPYLVAGLFACLFAWFSRNLLWTIVVGMMFFLGWQWFILNII